MFSTSPKIRALNNSSQKFACQSPCKFKVARESHSSSPTRSHLSHGPQRTVTSGGSPCLFSRFQTISCAANFLIHSGCNPCLHPTCLGESMAITPSLWVSSRCLATIESAPRTTSSGVLPLLLSSVRFHFFTYRVARVHFSDT